MYAAPTPVTQFQTDREEFHMSPKPATKKSTKPAATVTVLFDHVADTKNMVRYTERDQDTSPINLYIRKDQAEALGSPTALSVTIAAE